MRIGARFPTLETAAFTGGLPATAGKIELVVPYQLKALEGTDGQVSNVIVSTLDGAERALACDEQSAFGGIVAVNRPVDAATVERMVAGPQADVVIAPGYADGAIEALPSTKAGAGATVNSMTTMPSSGRL